MAYTLQQLTIFIYTSKMDGSIKLLTPNYQERLGLWHNFVIIFDS